MSPRLFLLQRLTALILAPLVLLHLAVIVYAVRNGLSAEEILGRTRDNTLLLLFYGLFVLVAAAHGAIGLRSILIEWAGLKPQHSGVLSGAACVLLLVLGLRAVWAVTMGGAP